MDLIGSSSRNLIKGKSVKNSNLIEYPTEIEDLNKWYIPKVPAKQIYNIGMFDFKSFVAIKTMERSIQVDNDEQSIKLLNEEDLQPFIDKYNFIHIGLIQIALKPLTLQGLNASLLTSLRDARCLDYIQSLMRVMQTSLCHGPVYFNVYPGRERYQEEGQEEGSDTKRRALIPREQKAKRKPRFSSQTKAHFIYLQNILQE